MQTGQKAVKVSVSASSLHRRDRIPTCCATRRRSAPAAARARRSLAEACSLSCGTQWVAPRCGPVASPLHLRRNCCRVFDGINVRMETAGLLLMTRHARPRGFACRARCSHGCGDAPRPRLTRARPPGSRLQHAPGPPGGDNVASGKARPASGPPVPLLTAAPPPLCLLRPGES